jgi:hypothetical protein
MAHPTLPRTPLGEEQIPAPVRRLFAAGTPAQNRLRVARGGAPLGPRDLVSVLYQLTLDADAEVAGAACKTAAELPDGVLLKVLAEPLDARILDLFAELCAPRPPAIEAILLNWATDDLTVLHITVDAGERQLEIVAANETRLVRTPSIIEALYLNKHTRMSTVDRVMEMAVRRGLRLDGIAAFDEIAASLGLAAPPPAVAPVPGTEAFFAAGPPAEAAGEPAGPQALPVDSGDTAFDSLLDMPSGLEAADAEEPEQTLSEAASDDKGKKIQLLNPSAKIRLAMLGNQFHRAVLVQDSNRMVAMAAIKSPSVTDMEAQRIAASRTVADDVIRYIANNKEWLKNYGIKKNLANNPKTPLTVSVRLLPHLHASDLRLVAKSRNIPAALRNAATQLEQQRRR